MSDQEFRDLLAGLNFEASYDARQRELTIRVTLVPELTSPDGDRAPLLYVPPAGLVTHLCRRHLRFATKLAHRSGFRRAEVSMGKK